jgi:uncharacterized protein with FMN-binding domain
VIASQERQRAETITERLFENAAKIRYGQVSVALQVHDGRITSVTYLTTESTREGSLNAKTPSEPNPD